MADTQAAARVIPGGARRYEDDILCEQARRAASNKLAEEGRPPTHVETTAACLSGKNCADLSAGAGALQAAARRTLAEATGDARSPGPWSASCRNLWQSEAQSGHLGRQRYEHLVEQALVVAPGPGMSGRRESSLAASTTISGQQQAPRSAHAGPGRPRLGI